MSTGPEHYRRAEDLLHQAYDLPAGSGNEFGALIAAQVHATLALAAATALQTAGVHVAGVTSDAWTSAVGADQ